MGVKVAMDRAHKSVVGACFGVELRSPCDEGVMSSGENKDCPSGQYPSLKDGSVSLETYNRIARFLLRFGFSTLDQSERQ